MELMDPGQVRIRAARRIDIRNQVKIYDEDMAIVNLFIRRVNQGFFSNQQIRFYAVLPIISDHGHVIPNKRSMVIITNSYIIYMRAFNFLEMLAENSVEKSLLMSEKLSNILSYQVLKFNVEDAKDVDHWWDVLMSVVSFMAALGLSLFLFDLMFPFA